MDSDPARQEIAVAWIAKEKALRPRRRRIPDLGLPASRRIRHRHVHAPLTRLPQTPPGDLPEHQPPSARRTHLHRRGSTARSAAPAPNSKKMPTTSAEKPSPARSAADKPCTRSAQRAKPEIPHSVLIPGDGATGDQDSHNRHYSEKPPDSSPDPQVPGHTVARNVRSCRKQPKQIDPESKFLHISPNRWVPEGSSALGGCVHIIHSGFPNIWVSRAGSVVIWSRCHLSYM